MRKKEAGNGTMLDDNDLAKLQKNAFMNCTGTKFPPNKCHTKLLNINAAKNEREKGPPRKDGN